MILTSGLHFHRTKPTQRIASRDENLPRALVETNVALQTIATYLGGNAMAQDEDDNSVLSTSTIDKSTPDETSDDGDSKEQTTATLFASGIFSLMGKRSHEVQEFMSRLRAQELCLAYEQSNIDDFELHKLPVAAEEIQVRRTAFGPCMTFKQAEDAIRVEQQADAGKFSARVPSSVDIQMTATSTCENSKVSKLEPTKSKHEARRFSRQPMRSCSNGRHPLNLTKRRSQKISKPSPSNENPQHAAHSSKKTSTFDRLTLSELFRNHESCSSSTGSPASVAPTEPESPMSCDGEFSAFC